MFNVKHMLKRLPFALIVWAIGAATCALVLLAMHDNAATLSASLFSGVATWLPYLIVVVCTVVTVMGSEQSFASLLWCLIFSVIFVMVTVATVSGWETDATFVAALLTNSEEGTVVRPVMQDSARVGIRFLVSLLLPAIVGMIISWAVKKKDPQSKEKGAKGSKAAKKSKKNGKK